MVIMNKKKIYDELTALKGKMRESKVSYKRLAKAINVSPNSLYLWFNGFNTLNTLQIINIAEELDIAPEEMLKYFFPSLYKQDRRCVKAPSYIK